MSASLVKDVIPKLQAIVQRDLPERHVDEMWIMPDLYDVALSEAANIRTGEFEQCDRYGRYFLLADCKMRRV